MRTILQEKVTIHCNIIIWFTNLFLCLKPWRYPQQKQQWIKNWRNWKRFRRKSEVKKRWSMKQGRRAQKFILPHWWTSVIWRMPNWRQSTKKIQRWSCTPRRYCKRWFWILCSIHRTRIISITNDSSKSHGYHIQTARVRRTSSRCSIRLHPSQNGRWSKIIENSQIEMSRHLDSSFTTQVAKIMVHHGRFCRYSWTKSDGHPLAGLLWERQFEKILLKYRWENVSNWECFFVHREKRLNLSVYLCMWMTSTWLERNKTLIRCGKVLNKEVDLGEPTSFPDHVYLGCTQRQCEISKDIVDNYRTMFGSRISAGGVEKLPFPQNLRISSWSYDMVGHAKKCVERYCELTNKTTQQLYKVSTPCIDDHHFKEEELKSVGEIVKSMLPNCSEMLILGTYWTTWYSMVSKQARTIHHKMDQSMWQTPESTDFIYSSYE